MSDIKTILVKDNVIKDISPDIDFAVLSGPAQTTYQKFPSTSSSNSALIWNVQIPSENVIIDRAVMITSGLSLNIVISSGANGIPIIPLGKVVFNYGSTDVLQAFPLNSLFTTVTTSINNTSLSINLSDVLPSLLKMNSVEALSKYSSMCPYMPDQLWGNYADADGTNSNVMGSAKNVGLNLKYLPRGVHPVTITNFTHTLAGAAVPVATGVNPWVSAGQANEIWSFTLNTITTEPIFLSPFLWGESEYNCAGLMGINNLSLTCNVGGSCNRVFSSMNKYISSISLNTNAFSGVSLGNLPTVTSPSLLFKFLSSQPSDLLQTKSVIPMLDFPRYLTANANTTQINPGASAMLTSSNLQLNCVPDKFLISVRIPIGQQTYNNPNGFLAINNVSINFSNSSGLLASASMYDLWRMSVKNGVHMTWEEWSGQLFVNTAANTGGIVPGLGSLLVISPAYDLSLPDYITANSLGNFNFQMNISVTNQYGFVIQPEICIIAVQSSILVTQQGVSSTYTGLLTKELVLATKSDSSAAMGSTEIHRITGGNLNNTPLTGFRQIHRSHGHKRGGSSSGGAFSGGASSGGSKLSKHY